MLETEVIVIVTTLLIIFLEKWMPHTIILAVLSMASSTFWSLLTIGLFRFFIL